MGKKEDIYDKITKLEKDFSNRIPEKFLEDIRWIWYLQHIRHNPTEDNLDCFILDTFKANYPNNKKSIKIIEGEFNKIHLKLKSDLNLIENVQKELF